MRPSGDEWGAALGLEPGAESGDLLQSGPVGQTELGEERSGGDGDGRPLGDLHIRPQFVALAGVVRLPLPGVLLVVRVVVGLGRQHHFLGSEHSVRRTTCQNNPGHLP